MSGASGVGTEVEEAPAAPVEAVPKRLDLDPEVQADLLGELAVWAASVRGEAERSELSRLAAAIAAGTVPAALQDVLARWLDLSLSSGRARRLHGAEVERSFAALHARTPAGAELARRAREAEAVLGALSGSVLQGIGVSIRRPGVVRIEIATELARLSLDVDRSGVSVDSLAVDF